MLVPFGVGTVVERFFVIRRQTPKLSRKLFCSSLVITTYGHGCGTKMCATLQSYNR